MAQQSKNEKRAKLVREINRLYHEEEAGVYDLFHPEIFAYEKKTWRRLAAFLPKNPSGLRILDIGSGTGFVPEALSEFLSSQDSMVLSDISPAMLKKSEQKLEGQLKQKLEYKIAEAEHLPFADGTFDVVTMNSVLHHIHDTASFLREVDRVLKPGGVCLIAHEPNRLFYLNPVLRATSWFLEHLTGLKIRFRRLIQPHGIKQATSHDTYSRIYRRVNNRLREKGLVAQDLTSTQIQSYVDIHSPTASGSADAREGFLIQNLIKHHFSSYKILYIATSSHLGKFSQDVRGVLLLIEKALRFFFPRSGSSFSLVLQKPFAAVPHKNF